VFTLLTQVVILVLEFILVPKLQLGNVLELGVLPSPLPYKGQGEGVWCARGLDDIVWI
jgi:hypothetical protein